MVLLVLSFAEKRRNAKSQVNFERESGMLLLFMTGFLGNAKRIARWARLWLWTGLFEKCKARWCIKMGFFSCCWQKKMDLKVLFDVLVWGSQGQGLVFWSFTAKLEYARCMVWWLQLGCFYWGVGCSSWQTMCLVIVTSRARFIETFGQEIGKCSNVILVRMISVYDGCWLEASFDSKYHATNCYVMLLCGQAEMLCAWQGI